jgi:hypothetical protein
MWISCGDENVGDVGRVSMGDGDPGNCSAPPAALRQAVNRPHTKNAIHAIATKFHACIPRTDGTAGVHADQQHDVKVGTINCASCSRWRELRFTGQEQQPWAPGGVVLGFP